MFPDILGYCWFSVLCYFGMQPFDFMHYSFLLFYQSLARLKILVSTDISVLGFYEYIGGYFYMNIDISEINKNTLKFMEILCKSVKMTLIIKYTH